MQLLMLETRRGSEDGLVVRRFMAGQVYEVAGLLAAAFLARGWAVRIPYKN